MQYLVHFILILLGMVLVSCTSAQETPPLNPLLPLPDEYTMVRDPGDELLMAAIEGYFEEGHAPRYTRYEFTRIDLNNDSRRDAIVLMKTPHSYWCDFNGCRMVVFRAYNDKFLPISEVAPVRGPLMVSTEKTNGWRDLVVRVSGRTGWDAKDVALKYDGRSYPPNPEYEPPMQIACNPDTAVKIFP